MPEPVMFNVRIHHAFCFISLLTVIKLGNNIELIERDRYSIVSLNGQN